MKSPFHIDGTEEFGYSQERAYMFALYHFENAIKRLKKKYPDPSVDNIKGYVTHFCYIRFVSFRTLIKVVNEQDYVTAGCILRMLADCLAVFHLVYMEHDEDLRMLRHCLYIIEGYEQNLKVLTVSDRVLDSFPPDEAKRLKEQTSWNYSMRCDTIKQLQTILDQSPLKERDSEAFDRIVKDRNWKFKRYETYQKINRNQYKWEDLYKMIDQGHEESPFLPFLSQYAHGLSVSNLDIGNDEVSRLGAIDTAYFLLVQLDMDLHTFFHEDKDYIKEGLQDPQQRVKMLLCFDEEHQQKYL